MGLTSNLAAAVDPMLLVAGVTGFFFGVFLDRGGLGNPHKLTGVFYFTDFTVPKVMFTAILTAACGLYLLSGLDLMSLDSLWIVPTYFWPQITGGVLFGTGFVLSGYCPGTSVAGLASGRLDALVAMAGIASGSFLFALSYPFIGNFYDSSSMGTVTLPDLTGLDPWAVIGILGLVALAMFFVMEQVERRG